MNEQYKGYIEIELNGDEINELYQEGTISNYDFYENEYVLVTHTVIKTELYVKFTIQQYPTITLALSNHVTPSKTWFLICFKINQQK